MSTADIPETDAEQGARHTESALKPVVVERYRADEVTPAYRLRQLAGRVADQAIASGGLALMLVPMLVVAALTLDLPFRALDHWAASPGGRPSLWMSRGDVVLALSLLLMILMARRFGAVTVSRAQGLSWLVVMVLSGLMLLLLAPQLSGADFPRGLYMLALVVSWYAGGQAAIRVYDATRGSRWWRAPLVAACCGFAVQTLLFFPLAYATTTAPWFYWWVSDLVLKMALAVAFLGLYRMLRRRIRPRPGLGGR